MAAAILHTEPLVSKPIIEDLIVEVAPRLELGDSPSFRRIYATVQASVNSVAAACSDLARLPTVIAEERRRTALAGPVCLRAFELFVRNMDLAD